MTYNDRGNHFYNFVLHFSVQGFWLCKTWPAHIRDSFSLIFKVSWC